MRAPSAPPTIRRAGDYNSAKPMVISERRVGDVTLLDLQGRLVFDDGDEEVRTHVNHLVSEARLKILLSLREVDYIDSCGVGVLIAKFMSLRRRGGDLRLVSISPRCRRVLTISRLLGVFQIFESEQDALASFADGAAR